jgi:hypothetical protein
MPKTEIIFQFFYPDAGDELPTHTDSKLILLTKFRAVRTGNWNPSFCMV